MEDITETFKVSMNVTYNDNSTIGRIPEISATIGHIIRIGIEGQLR